MRRLQCSNPLHGERAAGAGEGAQPQQQHHHQPHASAAQHQTTLERIGAVAPFGSWVSGLHTLGGDLDLSLDGWLEWRCAGGAYSGYATELGKGNKAEVLKYAINLLRQYGVSDGWVESVLHARVPIIKFRHSGTSLACDVSVDGRAALFKSALLGQLAAADWRVGALVRLVKAWAREQGINSAGDGTLSSHALTLMVVWHLQMRLPAVLPPIKELFVESGRPVQDGKDPALALLQTCGQRLRGMPHNENVETLVELLASFFSAWHALLGAWLDNSRSRQLVASTWHGAYATNLGTSFGTPIFSVEEPTNSSANVTRTVRTQQSAGLIVRAFERAEAHMRRALSSETEVGPTLRALFGDQLCRSSGALSKLNLTSSQGPVPIVPMVVPTSLSKYVHSGTLPTPATVDHQQWRG